MKIIRTKPLLLVLFGLIVNMAFAQQEAQYTHYMYNPSLINPAFTGYRNTLSASLIHRSQWIGMEGAPTTQSFSISTPLANDQVALGLNFSNDNVGPITDMGVSGDFSYTILTEKSNISFGIKAGVQRMTFDPNKLTIEDQTDLDFSAISNQIVPQIGIGVMFEKENLYLGLSALNLVETDYKNASLNPLYSANKRRNYYGTVGYLFSLKDNLDLKTSMLVKAVAGSPLQADVSANFLLNKKITLGAAYRWDAAVSALVGYQISKSFMIGAAYDYDTSPISNYTSGSGEIVLRYELLNSLSSKRIINPRIF